MTIKIKNKIVGYEVVDKAANANAEIKTSQLDATNSAEDAAVKTKAA
jgi:hypothetical protein